MITLGQMHEPICHKESSHSVCFMCTNNKRTWGGADRVCDVAGPHWGGEVVVSRAGRSGDPTHENRKDAEGPCGLGGQRTGAPDVTAVITVWPKTGGQRLAEAGGGKGRVLPSSSWNLCFLGNKEGRESRRGSWSDLG